ncbi:MAG: hypothetical protein K6E20_05915 [Acholeplasmatales bacterium]|nr:hypothetical protein [Acholeplasmatales bacterium]
MEEQNNILKNMRKRSIMLLIGIIFIIFFNTLYFLINYIIKGNAIVYLILDGAILSAMYVYLIYFVRVGMKNMYKSSYIAGQIIFVLPGFFFIVLIISDLVKWKVFNYESLAYSLISFILYFTTFRFNLRDKNPLKTNIRCIVAGVIGMILLPIALISQALSPRGFEITNLSRTLKYKVNDDDTLTVTGFYSGLSKKANVNNTYYTKEVKAIGKGAFSNSKGIKYINVDDHISCVETGAIDDVKKVTIDGFVELGHNSVTNVNKLVIKSKEKSTIHADSFDGNYLFVDRKYVDDFRKEFGVDNFVIAPNVKKNECYVNFDLSNDQYIKTAIINKGSELDPKLISSIDVLYNDTINYKNDNDYYKERYNNSLDVLAYWADLNGDKVDFNKRLSRSVSIKPTYEKIKKYEVDFCLGEDKIEEIYVSNSREYTLPTIEDMAREGFNNLTFQYNGNTINKLVYDGNSQSSVTANWTLEAPTAELVYNNQKIESIEKIYEYDYENDKSLEYLINVKTNHTLNDSSSGKLKYNCTWNNNDKGVITTSDEKIENGQLAVSQVNDTNRYSVDVVLEYEEYGHTYYSDKITLSFDCKIDKKETHLDTNNYEVIYDNNGHEPAIILSHPETYGDLVFSYKNAIDNKELDSKPILVGKYKVVVTSPESDNYLEASLEFDFEIKKRLVNIVLNPNMTSVYGDEFDPNYLNGSYTEGENSENQGIVAGTTLKIELSGVSKDANKYKVNAISLNANYDIHYDEVEYTVEKRTVNLNIENQSSFYGDEVKDLNYSAQEGEILEGDMPFELNTNVNTLQVGEYDINCMTKSLNYNIVYTKGKYVVLPREIKVAIDNKQSVYGDNTVLLTSKVVSGTIFGNDNPYKLESDATGNNVDSGEYEIIGVPLSNNYNIEFVNGVYTISQRKVNVIWENKNNVYNGNAQKPSAYYINIKNEKVNLTVSAEETINVGEYTATVSQLSSSNYILDESTMTTYYNIEKRIIFVSVDNKSSAYGDDLKELTSNVITGSIISGDNPYKLETVADKNVVDISAILTVCTDDNYEVESSDANYSVVNRQITISIDNKESYASEPLQELTYKLVEGSFVGDDGNLLPLNTNATTESEPGEYSITCGNLYGYEITWSTAIYTIIAK